MASISIPLDSVISNEELGRRPARNADRDAEQRALESLARQLSGSPRRVLQSLSDTALQLCRAHSAGISLVEEEGGRQIFRWHAVSGRWLSHLWNTLPREFSPCGTVLDRRAPQLMILPERYFTPLAQISPKVHEVLLIPFFVGEVIAGTVWIVAHDDSRRFDSEDRRVVSDLGKFAALAYAGLSALSIDEVVHLARLSKGQSLPRDLPTKSIQRRVLIVDHDQDAAGALAALLRRMGHQVHVAHEARAGLDMSLRLRPDVVLLDTAMPDMSGHDVVRQMRQALGPQPRIIAVPLDPGFLKSLIG